MPTFLCSIDLRSRVSAKHVANEGSIRELRSGFSAPCATSYAIHALLDRTELLLCDLASHLVEDVQALPEHLSIFRAHSRQVDANLVR